MSEPDVGPPTFFAYAWQAVLTVASIVAGLLLAAGRRELDKMNAKADAAMQKAEAVERSLAAHKTHAAERFATKEETVKLGDRLEERFDKQDEKLDRIVERLPPKRN